MTHFLIHSVSRSECQKFNTSICNCNFNRKIRKTQKTIWDIFVPFRPSSEMNILKIFFCLLKNWYLLERLSLLHCSFRAAFVIWRKNETLDFKGLLFLRLLLVRPPAGPLESIAVTQQYRDNKGDCKNWDYGHTWGCSPSFLQELINAIICFSQIPYHKIHCIPFNLHASKNTGIVWKYRLTFCKVHPIETLYACITCSIILIFKIV